MSTPGASIFQIVEHCDRDQFKELIGDYAWIVVSDRWPGYEHLDPGRRQVCFSRTCDAISVATQKGSPNSKNLVSGALS